LSWNDLDGESLFGEYSNAAGMAEKEEEVAAFMNE
jgi:hypothetical protein